MDFNNLSNISELALLVDLKRSGKGYHGPCPSCGYKTGFELNDLNGKILFYCHVGGCNFSEISEAIKKTTSWQNSGFTPAIVAIPATALSTKAPLKKGVAIDCDTQDRLIKELWGQAVKADGTPVEAYLRSRGITCPIPSSIRFLKDGYHSPTRSIMPMMVSKVTDTTLSLPFALHRTYLNPDGTGKATIEPNKMILGQVRGLGVYLAPVNTTMAVAEGIETALAAQQATGLSTIAALSAGGLQSLILPPLAREVIICADNDPVGLRAASQAAQRWSLENRRVKIILPPQVGMDFNDWLLASEGAVCL